LLIQYNTTRWRNVTTTTLNDRSRIYSSFVSFSC